MFVYKKLFKMMIDKDLERKDLVKGAPLSWNVIAKLNNNEYVSMEIIDRICSFLDCQPSDIILHIKSSNTK